MNKIKYVVIIYLFIIIIPSNVFAQIKQSEISFAERKIKLSWEVVEGAVSYKIVIKDLKGKTVIDKETDLNNYVLELQPDDYKIRIGSVNKFGKIGSWSDWADLIIEKPVLKSVENEKEKLKEKEREKEKEVSKSASSPFVFKIGIGPSYFDIQPDWNEFYKDSINAYSLDIAYGFRKVAFPAFFQFMKYTGLDVESNYVKFSGKKELNRIESDMTNIISGINFYISTNFDFPLNFALRGGGGLAYTLLDYQKYDLMGNPIDKGTSSTSAFYYKAGISVECKISSRFFIEGYADYYIINYLINDFKTLRFSCLAGIRL